MFLYFSLIITCPRFSERGVGACLLIHSWSAGPKVFPWFVKYENPIHTYGSGTAESGCAVPLPWVSTRVEPAKKYTYQHSRMIESVNDPTNGKKHVAVCAVTSVMVSVLHTPRRVYHYQCPFLHKFFFLHDWRTSLSMTIAIYYETVQLVLICLSFWRRAVLLIWTIPSQMSNQRKHLTISRNTKTIT